jgi:hypothetical protein
MRATTLFRSSLVVSSLAALAVACGAPVPEEEDGAGSTSGLTNRTVTLHFLGSQQFLLRCAGNTLGCGRPVASVSNTTPYFSAPHGIGIACDEYWTFRVGGRCVEARRLEVSDSHGFIEGNPGLFDALGLPHTDGNCSGTGTKPGVQMERGRRCGASGAGACTDDAECKREHPGGGYVCSTESGTCVAGCHADDDCASGKCDKTLPRWTCVPAADGGQDGVPAVDGGQDADP